RARLLGAMKNLLVWSLALSALGACSGGHHPEGDPRGDGGGGNFNPRGSGDGGGFNPSGDGGNFNPSGDGGGAGGGVYCGQSDSTECGCGTMPANGYTQNAACGPSQTGGSPSLCCATAAWPGA